MITNYFNYYFWIGIPVIGNTGLWTPTVKVSFVCYWACRWLFCREVNRTAGVSTTDVVGRMLLMTRQHFRRGAQEYEVGREPSSALGLDATARSPWTGCSQFLPTTCKIIQFSEGKEPQVHVLSFADPLQVPISLYTSCSFVLTDYIRVLVI